MDPKNNFINNLSKNISSFSMSGLTNKKPVTSTKVNQSFPISTNGATSPNMSYATIPTKSAQNMSYATPTKTNNTIRSGTKSDPNVMAQQKALNAKGAGLKEDGIMGPLTQAAIKKYSSSSTPTSYSGSSSYSSNLSPEGQKFAETLANTKKETITDTKTKPEIITQPENPYKKYLDSMTSDAQRLANIKNQIEAKELESRRLYEETLDKSGGTVAGAREAASLISRRSNQELADLSLRESAAARTAGLSANAYEQFAKTEAPIEVGGQLYQKQADGSYKSVAGGTGAEGFTLGKDQVRYDAQGNVIAGGIGGGSGSNEAPTIKTFGQTDYSWNPETSQWDPVALSDVSPQDKINKAQSVLDIIKTLGKDASGFTGAVGMKGLSSLFGAKDKPFAGTDAAGYASRFNQLAGMLTLENMGIMKGVLSDSDIKIIKEASTALNRDLKEDDYLVELEKIKKVMQKVIDKGGQGSNTGISKDEEAYLRSKGYTDEQIKSLSNVGKTSASNIPQQNKNPGNIKKGGLADSLAVGVDKQGHLIFPDEQTGFKAMQMDIQAKINGKSKYLPANPTLAQLGKVYAEDPNWTKSVAKILGVTPFTSTKQIPINNLVQAIARQEGYFA